MKNSSPLAIEASGLVKVFGETRAVDELALTVPAGSIYGVLGPNGAGKTTTIRILATLAKPTGGEARVFGYDVVRQPDKVRERVSLTGQAASVDEDLTGRENLILFSRLLGFAKPAARERADALLEAMDLTEAADRQAKTYSGGMRRRLDIAAGLLGAPDLLFLDEPTAGLDPRSRKQVWEIIRRLAEAGTTILLTTQYLEEADHLADRMVVIDHGRQIAEGTAAELKASVGTGALHVRLRDPQRRPDAERILAASLGVPIQRSGSDPTELFGRVNDPDTVPPALAELPRSGIGVAGFSLGQPSLDEVFLALTGKPVENGRQTPEPANAAKEVAA